MKVLTYKTALPEGLHGATFQTNGDRQYYLILLNEADTVQKRRFSFGHELGHIALHHFDTAATIDINTAGGAARVFYKGAEIFKDDHAPLYEDKPAWEIEADAAAWTYYRKYRDFFNTIEENGQGIITIDV